MTRDQRDHSGETIDETGLASTLGPPTSEHSSPSMGEHAELTRLEHFTLLEQIGSGGMGELYLARDERLGRKVALKLVRSGRRHDGRADDRLLREAQTLARISHPNVVTVFEVGAVEGRVFVAMEFVRGQTLSAWLTSVTVLPERRRIREILRRFVDAGRGLAAVHRAGLAHRDFKPDNVLVGEDGRVRVVDFGLARTAGDNSEPKREPAGEPKKAPKDAESEATQLGESSHSLPTLTEIGAVQGTPRYMAPEQWEGRRGDARSDQFSFCIALFEALWGRRPFEAKTLSELSRVVIAGELWLPPRKPEIPAVLRAAVLRGLSSKPSDRFATLDELLAVLDGVVAPGRRWIPVALGLSVSLVALVLMAFVHSGNGQAPDRAWLDEWQREQLAARHLAALEAQIDVLVNEGRHEEADQAFEAFATLPEHAGTHALTRGWLGQAERLRVRGAFEDELAALASAYVESPSDAEQADALFGLARSFAGERRHDRLAATLETLDELDTSHTPERAAALADHRLQVAVARCDLAGASGLVQHRANASAIEQFGRFTATSHVLSGSATDGVPFVLARQMPGLDLDGDERSELILLRADEPSPVIVAAKPNLPELRVLDLPAGQPAGEIFIPRASATADPKLSPKLMGVRRDQQYELLELTAAGERVQAELRHSWSAPPGSHWAIGDLDDRLGHEVYVGHVAGRRLLGLRADRGLWQPFEPHPATDVTRSVLRGVVVGDVDGDGTDELVVAAAEWAAYDVRILRRSVEQPDRLELIARHKLGTVGGLELIRDPTGPGMRIVVSVSHAYPSRKVFPSEAPGGEPPGLYQLRWRGEGHAIERVAHVAAPGASFGVTGDFDGNGLEDYATGLILPEPGKPLATLAWLAQPDGNFTELVMRGLWPVGAAPLDDDDDDELIIVQDEDQRATRIRGPIAVLGAGDDPPPQVELSAIAGRPPPEDLDAALDRTWRRAERLAAIGLATRARETLSELATVADPLTAGRARQRAAELAEQTGRLLEAAQLYERAALPEALAQAVELYDRLQEFRDAHRLAEKLASHPDLSPEARADWQARTSALQTLAEPSRRVFEFDEPLDETWRIETDLAFRREAGGLRVDTVSGGGPHVLARWPVVPTGEPITLDLEVDVLRLEWGGSLGLELRRVDVADEDGGGDAYSMLAIHSWGGGSLHRIRFDGLNDAMPDAIGLPVEHPTAQVSPERRRYRLRASWVPDRSEMLLTVEGPGLSARAFKHRAPLAPGRYELRVVGSTQLWVRGTFWIDRLTTTGLADDPEAPPLDRAERIRLALANGQPELASEWIAETTGESERETELMRMLVLDELGRWDEAEAAFERAVDRCAETPEAEAAISRVLILQPDRFGPTLRRICPSRRFNELLWKTVRLTVLQHPELEDVFRTLTTQTVDLDPDVRDFEESMWVLPLLHARAQGWRQQGVSAAARADLQRGIALAERLLAKELDPADRVEIRQLLAACHTALALALLEQDNEAEALVEIDRALTLSAAPEIVADTIFVSPEFAALRDNPEWLASLERVRAGLAYQH